MATCPNGAGSINNPNGTPAQTGLNNNALAPYVPYTPAVGTFEISKLNPDSYCETSDQLRQESYVAETLNISGAPINVFKLLGVHEQGNGSLLSLGKMIASQSSPGFPLSNINSITNPWKSILTGSANNLESYVGIDFGFKTLPTGQTEYAPPATKWSKVGSLSITQGNTANEYARQVKVEVSDGQVVAQAASIIGAGNGLISVTGFGENVSQGEVFLTAVSDTVFNVYFNANGTITGMPQVIVGVPYYSTIVSLNISAGSSPFQAGDFISIPISYKWTRAGIFNLTQSPLPQTLNFNKQLNVRAVRVTPTLFTGTGNWEVYGFDIFDSVATDINNIQDLFFNENRDRDYSLEPITMKVQYAPADSMSDLSRFGLSILDQYTFSASFADMVQRLGRPVVTGDIIEVIPEMQYDHNLKPIRKFLEVTDTGWEAAGFSTMWKPILYRFSASQATPSQENRDIFGTIDTQKYLVADSVLTDGIGEQIDTTPLTQMEEIIKDAKNAVPETGSDDGVTTGETHLPPALPPSNAKGQPLPSYGKGKPNIYIEDGLPKDGAPYGEGYALPDTATASDGEYFRMNYPADTKIPARLYRFSAVKNRWLYMETDRRAVYSSHKPSVRNIMQSSTNQPINKKL